MNIILYYFSFYLIFRINIREEFIMLLFGITLLILIVNYLIFRLIDKDVINQRNLLIGYRTPSSLKSSEAWTVAQKYFQQNFKRIHIIFLIISFIWIWFDLITSYKQISFWIQVLVYLIGTGLIIALTEIKLYNFNHKQKG
ncbi:SdpI family protein [Staphylococcus condimenti]